MKAHTKEPTKYKLRSPVTFILIWIGNNFYFLETKKALGFMRFRAIFFRPKSRFRPDHSNFFVDFFVCAFSQLTLLISHIRVIFSIVS